MTELRDLIREYVEALTEAGPVAHDDTAGMVMFTRPTTDPDDVEEEFEREQFEDLVRRIYRSARSENPEAAMDEIPDAAADSTRRIRGIEIDRDDLESELERAAVEEDEFSDATPEEKSRYYADPKWYTKYF